VGHPSLFRLSFNLSRRREDEEEEKAEEEKRVTSLLRFALKFVQKKLLFGA